MRINNKEYRFNHAIRGMLFNEGRFSCNNEECRWIFSASYDNVSINGTIFGNRSKFVKLEYYNPPGGSKDCLK
jgi:hypothetical protein